MDFDLAKRKVQKAGQPRNTCFSRCSHLIMLQFDLPAGESAMVRSLTLFAVLQVALVTNLFAQPQSPPAGSEPSLWDHNGSVVYLIANGSQREFYYKEPRPGMLEAGARPGSLLFRGQTANGQYFGTAYIFNRRCGQFPYEVKGPILDNYERVVLTGQAPRVGEDCDIDGYITDTLEFTLLKPGRSSAPIVFVPMPDVNGIWKPLSADNRLMTMRLANGKITVEANDLFCTLSDLQTDDDALMTPPGVTANSVCNEESDVVYAKETLTILKTAQDFFLIDATTTLRLENENSDPKVDETYTNRAPVVTIYRKVR
jgi:hypothetical protein